MRVDTGDLTALKESMERTGLLNPISITDDKELLAGFRRLQCARELGWTQIECHIVKAASRIEKLQIEADENLTRKEFTPEEMVRIDEEMRYLSSKGFEKFRLWVKRTWADFKQWFKKTFRDNESNSSQL